MSVEPKKWGVIYNPKAGTRKVKKRWKEIKEYMDSKGVDYDYVQSEGFGSVERLAKILANNGYRTIVIVGGDGALNDAINGIMLSDAEDKENIALGMIPNGIGNDFAKYWGLSTEYKPAVDCIINHRLKKIDVGYCNFYDGNEHQRRYFLNAVNIGLGARIVKITDQTKRFWGVKFLSYVAALFSLIFERKLYRMHLRINDEHIRGRIMTVCIGSAWGLDPPLHEFVPHDLKGQQEMADTMGVSLQYIQQRVESLCEHNPMLGHRGCRLGNTYPEITQMQTRAILGAALELKKEGVETHPEIMVPLTGILYEFKEQENVIRTEAAKLFEELGDSIDFKVGTMIEIPRAALTADRIASSAEFFSFGTNDLTQMTFGYSRDDIASFLPVYLEKKILKVDPFQVLDQNGVGQLVRMATEKGRAIRPDLKCGICGEHGGEPSSVKFCHRVGLNYVSCSPFRVPIARLAAAQAAIEG